MTPEEKKREYNRRARAKVQKRKVEKTKDLTRKEQTRMHVEEIARVAARYAGLSDSSPFLGAEKGL